jgi:hypothetical protein
MSNTQNVSTEQMREALEEIALAGMSGSGQESEEGLQAWHARQAWKFIAIAARALEAHETALTAPAAEPNGWRMVKQDGATVFEFDLPRIEIMSDSMDGPAGHVYAEKQTPAAEVPEAMGDADILTVAEFVGLIGPGSRVGDSHNAAVRFGRALLAMQSTRLRGGVPERAALTALFKDAMDWGRSYGQRLNLSDITVADVSEGYADKALREIYTAAPQAPALDAGDVAAYEVWWGLGNMRPLDRTFRTREEAEQVASEIRSNTEVRPLHRAAMSTQAGGNNG